MVLTSSSDCTPVSVLSCGRKCTKDGKDFLPRVGYEVKKLSGRGSGLIATKCFYPGDLIMREKPIINMPDKIFRYNKFSVVLHNFLCSVKFKVV